ncbi:hypothetical protein HPP92_028313 [Vanilla planifolia]|uniref:Uncharacterized protein n=1 Tax=Vanilla planifolia TaxID=51239 RepID=A0A835U651_VANPL|nr:hypothetical protein HPP92_028313 [Vanilla planifolia]KAG0447551.1 hypothetical protein HPP92_028282 [Vanilla planifolia]
MPSRQHSNLLRSLSKTLSLTLSSGLVRPGSGGDLTSLLALHDAPDISLLPGPASVTANSLRAGLNHGLPESIFTAREP